MRKKWIYDKHGIVIREATSREVSKFKEREQDHPDYKEEDHREKEREYYDDVGRFNYYTK